jgi:sarcosine/dimethylglycine N-methyltransferase
MKSMKLYVHVERIFNELRELGLDKAGQLSVDALTPFDQYHYLGTEAVDEAARSLEVTPASRILEIGSGIGGPARYLAARTGCRVVALELQPDLHETGRSLTVRCGLDEQVLHVEGDVLASALDGGFDGIMSFLVFLHIPSRKRLFDICHAALKPGHAMYIEDFVLNRAPSAEQRRDLEIKVMCPYLPDAATYARELEASGFTVERFEDQSRAWSTFTAQRLDAFRQARQRNIRVHGEAVTAGLDDFYSTVAALYAAGVLGGARIVARRPA